MRLGRRGVEPSCRRASSRAVCEETASSSPVRASAPGSARRSVARRRSTGRVDVAVLAASMPGACAAPSGAGCAAALTPADMAIAGRRARRDDRSARRAARGPRRGARAGPSCERSRRRVRARGRCVGRDVARAPDRPPVRCSRRRRAARSPRRSDRRGRRRDRRSRVERRHAPATLDASDRRSVGASPRAARPRLDRRRRLHDGVRRVRRSRRSPRRARRRRRVRRHEPEPDGHRAPHRVAAAPRRLDRCGGHRGAGRRGDRRRRGARRHAARSRASASAASTARASASSSRAKPALARPTRGSSKTACSPSRATCSSTATAGRAPSKATCRYRSISRCARASTPISARLRCCAASGGIGYASRCRCFSIDVAAGHRLGRDGLDGALTLRLAP